MLPFDRHIGFTTLSLHSDAHSGVKIVHILPLQMSQFPSPPNFPRGFTTRLRALPNRLILCCRSSVMEFPRSKWVLYHPKTRTLQL